jgi:hypothetical protein
MWQNRFWAMLKALLFRGAKGSHGGAATNVILVFLSLFAHEHAHENTL